MQWTNRVGFVFTHFSEFEMTVETQKKTQEAWQLHYPRKGPRFTPPLFIMQFLLTSHRVFLFWITPIWGVIKKRYGYFPFYDLYNQDDFCKIAPDIKMFLLAKMKCITSLTLFSFFLQILLNDLCSLKKQINQHKIILEE